MRFSRRIFLLGSILLIAINAEAQHTFSIVAVDSVTGEVGSAGATCGDSIVWPGTKGAAIIADLLPGVGAINTQSFYLAGNQQNARKRMEAGDSPSQIISWLENNDVQGNKQARQYGVVTYNSGSPQSAAFTGTQCMDYKNHIIGPNYAIQGNILSGQEILDSMEARFKRRPGCLADKLMEALQGANVVGADSRCKIEGTSSLSSYLKVAKPTDRDDSLTIDIVIAGTPFSIEPIDTLQKEYDKWKANNPHSCVTVSIPKTSIKSDFVYISAPTGEARLDITSSGIPIDRVEVYSLNGQILHEMVLRNHETSSKIYLRSQTKGAVFVLVYSNGTIIGQEKVVVR